MFAAYQLGLFGITTQLIDSLNRPGGQCSAFYADKPIYDLPGFGEILAQDLVARLQHQCLTDAVQITLGATVTTVALDGDDLILRHSSLAAGEVLRPQAIVFATGIGSFSPQVEGDNLVRNPTFPGMSSTQPELFPVNPASMATSEPGIFAIGDACHYPGKLRLLVSAFHEAALMAQAVRSHLNLQKGRKTSRRGNKLVR